jgi:hypothetical protein
VLDRSGSSDSFQHPLLALQATAGNQAVLRLVAAAARSPSPAVPPSAPSWSVSRRWDADERTADRRAAAAARLSSEDAVIDHPDAPRSYEAVFGHDFSGVRIHTDATAAQFAGQVGARAATVGRQIFFARDAYEPGTESGRDLLLHELAHATQHDGNREPRVRRQGDSCADLMALPNISLLAGPAVHALIQADFAARVPGAQSIMIPGASAGPQRTEGICGGDSTVIPPQLLGGAAGAGFPDLARRSEAGVLSVAEIKPAAWECLVDGEVQLARYIDQGNATDEQQAAWRTSTGVTAVVPMQPSVYSPPTIAAGKVTIRTAWCAPGMLVYSVTMGADPGPVAVPEKQRETERERLARQALERGVVIGAAAGVAAVAGRALWRHFWRVVATRFAARGAVAALLAAADGPLPFGELIDAGLAVVTVIQIGVEWNELWRQADQLAADEGA